MAAKRSWKSKKDTAASQKIQKVQKTPKRARGIAVVAFWMILSVLPWMYWDLKAAGYDVTQMMNMKIETGLWAVYLITIICAFGLLAQKGWAWKGTLFLFFLHVGWSVYSIYYLMGPSFLNIIAWGSDLYNIPLHMFRNICFVLIMTYAVWPIIVILYLLHPRVKENFSLALPEISIADIKPG